MQGQLNSVVPNYESLKYVRSREQRIEQYQYKLQYDESQMKHQMEYIDSAIFVFLGFYSGFYASRTIGRTNSGIILAPRKFQNDHF